MGIKEMRILAEEGSLPHILAFADMHFGFGDYQEALRWYRMAAQQTAAPQVTQRVAQCEACLAMTPQELPFPPEPAPGQRRHLPLSGRGLVKTIPAPF